MELKTSLIITPWQRQRTQAILKKSDANTGPF